MKTEKLQKVLARAGYGSRRQLEEWIKQGRVEVNDHVATLGDRVANSDKVYLDGRFCDRIGSLETRVILYHKPVGVVTTRHDPEGRETVFSALPPIRDGRWVNVGRLDYNTSGLLLFTNNGELAHQLMHPSTQMQREYLVRVMGRVTQQILQNLTNGVVLEDGMAKFEELADVGGEGLNHWYRVVVVEGRNRIVRRLWDSQDIKVNRLVRVRFGPVFLPKSLRAGAWLELEKNSVNHLCECSKLKQPARNI